MPDSFFSLPDAERREALLVAADKANRPAYLLEKDVWVVEALRVMYRSQFADDIVFKGGTSLSKGYRAIERFSEDVDLTYDIRKLAPDCPEYPETRAQIDRWAKRIREELLPEIITNNVKPHVESQMKVRDGRVTVTCNGENIYIDYPHAVEGYAYVNSSVRLEFGARSTGQPAEAREISCDAAPYVDGIVFPIVTATTMLPVRSFWEKVTAIHVFCRSGDFGTRCARHWHDILALRHGHFVVLADRTVANEVARHKQTWFRYKDRNKTLIDYHEAVSGDVQLVPDEGGLRELRTDYYDMIKSGLLPKGAMKFDELMTRCRQLEEEINRLYASKAPPEGKGKREGEGVDVA